MAQPELLNSIAVLSKKIDVLIADNESLQERVKELENLNRQLSIQHQEDMSGLDKAMKEIEFLKVSHRLAASPEALISARKIVSKLIRTVDNCIRMINED